MRVQRKLTVPRLLEGLSKQRIAAPATPLSGGPEGAPGVDGRPAGLRYKFDTATGAADPGTGELRLNNAALASATALYISETDADANALAAYLATWDDSTSTVRGQLVIRSVATASDFAVYNVTGSLSDEGVWDKWTIAHLASGGAFSNGEEITVQFIRTGDKGTEGAEGKEGAAGKEGPAGSGGGIVGQMIEWPGISLPEVAGQEYKWCDGTAVSRTTYATLFARIALSTTANRTSGSKALKSIPSTTGMKPGMPISGTGIKAGTTIETVNSGTEITMSQTAESTGEKGALVVAPYGVGNGTTTFNLPDERGRVPVAPDDMGGSDAGRISKAAQQLGGTGGEETHKLTVGELAKHNHLTHNSFTTGAGLTGFTVQFNLATKDYNSSDSEGGDEAHNNMQPFLNVNKVIRVS